MYEWVSKTASEWVRVGNTFFRLDSVDFIREKGEGVEIVFSSSKSVEIPGVSPDKMAELLGFTKTEGDSTG
jgi:hypothetical protein